MTVYLEYMDDVSAKFWQIEVSGTSHTVTYGKIGTQGQSKTKSFDTIELCQKDADKLINAKKAKGYAPVGQKGITPKTHKDDGTQAMFDELDALIGAGDDVAIVDFLQKYKAGNTTALKKQLQKLMRYWLDYRRIELSNGGVSYCRRAGAEQQKCLMMLALGLLSPSDYGSRYHFLSWIFHNDFLNDEGIDRLQKMGAPILPTIVSENTKGGTHFDYGLLRKLENKGLLPYDPLVFISAFGSFDQKHIKKHNEHLTRLYRQSNKDGVSFSKFYHQYQYEGKQAPDPKKLKQADQASEQMPDAELYEGQAVPFVSLDLSAFDDDPIVKGREFVDLFEHETPIAERSRWGFYRYEDSYHNVKNGDFANPFHQWIGHFIATGQMDKHWVLTKCLEIQTSLWADANKSFFRQLFDHLSPTDDDKLALQDSLFVLLTHEHKSVVNFALKHLKSIYQDERFEMAEFVGHWQALLMSSDNKTAIKTLLGFATNLLKATSFAHTDTVLSAILGAFLVSDVAIQEKSAKLIAKYALPTDSFKDELSLYQQAMNADSQKTLASFLKQAGGDEATEVVSEYKPSKQIQQVMGEEVVPLVDFHELLFTLGGVSQDSELWVLENILSSYLKLLYANQLPDDAHTQLKAVLKRHKNSYLGNSLADMFTESWYNYIFENKTALPSRIQTSTYHKPYRLYYVWHNIFLRFCELIELYQKTGQALPLISTPTHTEGNISFHVFMDRLIAHQNLGVAFDFTDVALAQARTSLDGVSFDECQRHLDELNHPYLKEILRVHFGCDDVPDTTPPKAWIDNTDLDELKDPKDKDSTTAKTLTRRNRFKTDVITSNNWQAWRGLWAVAVLTHHPDVHLNHHHEGGRIFDEVVHDGVKAEYRFTPITLYEYDSHTRRSKETPTGKYDIHLTLPPYLRWSAVSDIYRRQYYQQESSYLKAIYYLEAGVGAEMVAIRTFTPHRPEFADAIIAQSVLEMYENNQVAEYQKLLGAYVVGSMPNDYAHITLSHLLFHNKKQVRQMTSDALSLLIGEGKLDDVLIARHASVVIHKGDYPFVRLAESLQMLSDYGAMSAVATRQIIAHLIMMLELNKLPVGFKKLIELYYTLCTAQKVSPSEALMARLKGFVQLSSSFKSIVAKFQNNMTT